MQRREFIKLMGALAAAAALDQPLLADPPIRDAIGPLLPTRPLGDTGVSVTCLGLGGYHIGWTTESLAQATIEAALEEGVRFFDTADSYGPGTSETRYGKYLTPKHRDHIFLMTKTDAKTADDAAKALDASLKRLNTDHLDLWQFHDLRSPADVDARLDAGVLDFALKAQQQGKVKYIGFTGHASPAAHQHMLAATADQPRAFAACQFPVNPVDAASPWSFIRDVLPAATQRKIGVLAMKTLADGHFFSEKRDNTKVVFTHDDPVIPQAASIADCIGFALSLPISVLITGAEKPEYVREKAALVRAHQTMSAGDRKALVERVARFATVPKVEYYKSRPAPQQP